MDMTLKTPLLQLCLVIDKHFKNTRLEYIEKAIKTTTTTKKTLFYNNNIIFLINECIKLIKSDSKDIYNVNIYNNK